jgi:hypothetical protein
MISISSNSVTLNLFLSLSLSLSLSQSSFDKELLKTVEINENSCNNWKRSPGASQTISQYHLPVCVKKRSRKQKEQGFGT